jgi:hypothetical protein
VFEKLYIYMCVCVLSRHRQSLTVVFSLQTIVVSSSTRTSELWLGLWEREISRYAWQVSITRRQSTWHPTADERVDQNPEEHGKNQLVYPRRLQPFENTSRQMINWSRSQNIKAFPDAKREAYSDGRTGCRENYPSSSQLSIFTGTI